MTNPICRHCNEPVSKHEAGRAFDACMAKAIGIDTKHELAAHPTATHYKRCGKCFRVVRCAEPLTTEPCNAKILHYSTDIRDAMPLMKDCIIVVCVEGYGILPPDYLTNPPIKTVFIAQAKTLPLVLCHRTLTEDAKGE